MNKKTCLLTLCLSILLSSCISFSTKEDKNENKDTSKEKTVEGIKENPQDNASMESSTHLKFMGVPIDGKLDDFVSRMKRKGFEHIISLDNAEVLQGDFADFKQCKVYVSTLDQKDLVSKITVVFPDQDQWKYLYGDYKHLKEMLTEKYGKPSSCVEEFQSSYGTGPQDDQNRMFAVSFDKCNYETRFTTDNGEIALKIEHSDVISCYVTLSYIDKENGNAIREHAKEDL